MLNKWWKGCKKLLVKNPKLELENVLRVKCIRNKHSNVVEKYNLKFLFEYIKKLLFRILYKSILIFLFFIIKFVKINYKEK